MNKYIINRDVLFPDMNNYNMHKPGEMALYLAHCDLLPFRSVIENNKMVLDMLTDSYFKLTENAREEGLYDLENRTMMNNLLTTTRVDLLTQYSLLITMVSLFEEAVYTLCNVYYEFNKLHTKVYDIKGQGLSRAKKYLKEQAGIVGFTSNKYWEYVDTICEARHMIVHNGGRIINDTKKFDKFNIGYREEDHQIYIEYDDIIKMYNGILDFIEIAFKTEPKE